MRELKNSLRALIPMIKVVLTMVVVATAWTASSMSFDALNFPSNAGVLLGSASLFATASLAVIALRWIWADETRRIVAWIRRSSQ